MVHYKQPDKTRNSPQPHVHGVTIVAGDKTTPLLKGQANSTTRIPPLQVATTQTEQRLCADCQRDCRIPLPKCTLPLKRLCKM